MTINGIALLIGLGFAAVVGIICYGWGRSDGYDAGAEDAMSWCRRRQCSNAKKEDAE